MYKKKISFRMLLVFVCLTLAAGCLCFGALASSVNSVLQVNSASSSASVQDGSIQVMLAQNDVFTYNEILDLSASSKDVPLLSMEFQPAVVGKANATRVQIRFTDLYDETNYVTICLNNMAESWANGHIYITAGAADQPQVGVENSANPDSMNVHVGDIYGYGAAVDYSMVGMPKSSEDTCLTLYFDYEEKALYADRETYTHSKQLLVDLDEPNHFGSDLWDGFTTGQVKMSVSASNYQSATCDFTISTINGNSQFRDTDESAPIILINTGYEQGALPVALVGAPYPLFDATAIDGCDGNMDVTATVYYEDDTGSMAEVAVENGKFTPSQVGVYVVEYSAQDRSGNASTASVRVNAVVSAGLQVTLQNALSETYTGVPVQILSGIDYTGASGNVSYSITAKNTASNEEIAIDADTYSFVPMSEGDWEVTVTVQDYISTVVKTFAVKVHHTSQPQVYDTVAVPDYFIKDATYQLPVLYGYDFSSGKGVLTAMDAFVTENGSSEEAVSNGQYVPSNTGSVTITYRLTVDGKTCEKSYTATVVNVKTILNTLNMSKYFVDPTGAASGSTSSSKITYSFKADTRLNFVNFVQVKSFNFAFQTGSQKAYNKISIYLTDVISGKQVKLTYNRTSTGATFSVNDGAEIALTSGFDSAFSLSFANDTGIAIPESDTEIKVKNFLDGSEFTGFTDSVARFTVELSDVTGSSQFTVQTLNGQKLYNGTKDSVAPQFFANALSGSVEKGETLKLNGAFVHDVLSPTATVTLKVTDPDGVAVVDTNGITLNGSQDASKDTAFTLNKLGTYTILYTATDGNKNSGRHVYTITATDGEGPTITLLEHTKSVKPGDTVTIAGTQVQDNITTNCTVVAYVFDPKGVNIPVTNGSFVASERGVYSVRYMAFDGDNNYAFASYEITAMPEQVSYLHQSMSLGADLSLHLWGNVPQGFENAISGTLIYGGIIDSFKLNELNKGENGLYHVQADMAVAQMTESIDLALKHNILQGAVRKTYSIRDYLVYLIEGGYDQETKKLCLELLNFGAAAQQYFRVNTGDLANRGHEIVPGYTVPADAPEVSKSGDVSGITFYGTSVRFLSKTSVRFYFKVDNGVDGYTFTIDDTVYEPVAKDNLYYIETAGINPQDMNDVITVTVADGANTLSVEYAPIWYFIRTYNRSDDATTKNLMTAAYSYYQEAAQCGEQTTAPSGGNTPASPTGEGAYICMDVLFTTLSDSTESVDIGFVPQNFAGSINDCTERFTIQAGTTATIKLDAGKYMVDGVFPEGLGVVVFGGPEWDDVLSDGYTPDRHTLTISNARVEGILNRKIELRGAIVASGNNGTGYTDANGSGAASIVNGAIVISNGFRYDAHKITLEEVSNTTICVDMRIDTLGNSTDPIEIRFYRNDFEGSVHNNFTDKVLVTAGQATTVKLDLNNYLVNGELPGIGFAIFGGPTWDAKLPDGYTPDRHTVTISRIYLEGDKSTEYDLSESVWSGGNNGTGYTDANGSGVASIHNGSIVITNGFCYDGHKITLVEDTSTYLCLDLLMTTLSNSTNAADIRFYNYNYADSVHNGYTDIVTVNVGTKASIKLKVDKYLVDGELPGFGVAIFGGPEWNTQISEGVYDRHSVVISNVRLDGAENKSFDLNDVTIVTGGLPGSNGGGVASVVDGEIVITGGFCYDGHKITFN